MFEREHHRRIATVLEALDAEVLRANHCLFGGGTAIAMLRGEYRESRDIDFLVSDVAGFRVLRTKLMGRQGIHAIARRPSAFTQLREVRADQYGIRSLLQVRGVEIKFEIVLEARLTLEAPGADDQIAHLATLTKVDLGATKLLANSDRWRDDAVHSRDLIDLAMLQLGPNGLKEAKRRARGSYGDSIDRDLKKAVEALRQRKGRLQECMGALQMTTTPAGIEPVPLAVVWNRIRRLAPRS